MRTSERAHQLAVEVEARADLYFFARYMFKMRRGFRWRDNWHHAAVCNALMKVWRGETNRLIINIPPRYSKTELAVVNFIAWCMGNAPDCEFIHTSYSGTLAVNNAGNTKQLVEDPHYRAVFPEVQLRTDSKAKGDWKTTAGGVVYAQGAGGAITGFGAGKLRSGFGGCFPHGELVETESGPKSIGDLVNDASPIRVWSYNEQTKQLELRHVTRFWRNPANHIVEVSSVDGRAMRCTPDHEVLTRAGWISAVHLAKSLDLVDGEPRQFGRALAGDGAVGGDLDDAFRVLWLCVPSGVRQALRDACPGLAKFNLTNDTNDDAIPSGQLSRAFSALENGRGLVARELSAGSLFEDGKCPVADRVLHVVGLGAIREIGQRVARGVAIEMPDLVSERSWAYELFCNQVRNVAHDDLTIDRQIDAEVALPILGRLERSQGICPTDLTAIGHLVEASGAADWTPDRVRYVGYIDETFCLEVEGNHNFVLASSGAIVSNCIIIDDPHKPDEVASPIIREGVIEWFKNTLESRVNDPGRTPIILIMQRLHERDLAGWLLEGGNGEEWDHVHIPAISDKGEALWPAMHDLAMLRRMETVKPFEFAGQYQQRPAPRGGAMFKGQWFEIVDALPAGLTYVRDWDLAGTVAKPGTDPDWTVGAKMGRDHQGFHYIADIRRFRGSPHEVERMILNTAKQDGTSCMVSIKQDPGQAGKAQAEALTRMLAGFVVKSSIETGSKELRAAPYASQCEAGNIRLLRADWNKPYLDEIEFFPFGRFDDQVDATASAFNVLAANSGPARWLSMMDEIQSERRDQTT